MAAVGPPPGPPPSYDDEPDILINVPKAKNGGYGITCTQQDAGSIIASVVTAVDANSEAAKAGVQKGDRLIYVKDIDGLLPVEGPLAAAPVPALPLAGALTLTRRSPQHPAKTLSSRGRISARRSRG